MCCICPLVVILMGVFSKKMPLTNTRFPREEAELWEDSIRAIGAGRIAELPPIRQMDFVQFSLELSTMLVCFCELCGFYLSLTPTRHPGNTKKLSSCILPLQASLLLNFRESWTMW